MNAIYVNNLSQGCVALGDLENLRATLGAISKSLFITHLVCPHLIAIAENLLGEA